MGTASVSIVPSRRQRPQTKSETAMNFIAFSLTLESNIIPLKNDDG
jgi:hypothetical protein